MSEDALQRVRSFLVPLDGSDAAFHALSAVLGIALGTGARVVCLHVIEVPRSIELDAPMMAEIDHGEQVLARAEELAQDQRMRVRAQLVQARQAGHAVVDEAEETSADAIVVGLPYHRPYGRFDLGRLATYVLANAPCEVWLMRSRPAEGELQQPAEPFIEGGHLLARAPPEDEGGASS